MQSWPSFFFLLGRYKKFFLALILMGALEIGLQASIRYASQKIIDDVLPQKNYTLLIITCFILALLALSQVSLGGIGEWWSKKIAGKFTNGLKKKVFKKILQLPVEKSYGHKMGDSYTLIQTDTENVGGLLQGGFLAPIKGMLMLMVGMGFIFLLNPLAGAIYLATCVLATFAGLWFIYKMRFLQSDMRSKLSELNSSVNQSLLGVSTIKSFLKDLYFARKNMSVAQSFLRSRLKSQMYNIVVHRLSWLIYWMFIVLAWLIGGSFWIKGHMSLGELVAFHFFADFIFDPIFMLIHSLGEIQTGLISSEKIHQLLLEKKDISRPFEGVRVNKLDKDIHIKSLSYQYPNGNYALNNIETKIRLGKFTLIAGPSGAGKSSLLKLLIRLMPPTQGEIFIGSYNLSGINLGCLREKMAWVPQDIWLMDGSLLDNVVFGNKNISRKDIEEALEISQCTGFISSLPKGLDNQVGELGYQLSGGEKQRIALARALVQKPELLLLDEFSSALDPGLELKILQGLKELCPKTTIVAAAHRQSLLEFADDILIMENGSLASEESLNYAGNRLFFNQNYGLPPNNRRANK